jgi:hypothetical protein
MFDLERVITKWRKQMASGGVSNPVVLDELESHLREEIERQMRAGASAEQAFQVATQKIGAANALKNEFRKAVFASVLEKLMIAIAVLFAAFGIFLTTATMILCYGTLVERLAGFGALAFILLTIFGSRHLVPLLPVIPRIGRRFAVQLACIAAGFGICALYVQVFVHQFERPNQMVPVIAFWGILPIAMGFGLASALEQGVRRSQMKIINT